MIVLFVASNTMSKFHSVNLLGSVSFSAERNTRGRKETIIKTTEGKGKKKSSLLESTLKEKERRRYENNKKEREQPINNK